MARGGKTLAKLRADPRIESVEWEPGHWGSPGQWWVELAKGWSFGGTGEAHCGGEDTLRDVQNRLRWVATKCECEDCKRGEP